MNRSSLPLRSPILPLLAYPLSENLIAYLLLELSDVLELKKNGFPWVLSWSERWGREHFSLQPISLHLCIKRNKEEYVAVSILKSE